MSDSIKNIFQENLRDMAVQKRLIKDYLKDYDPNDEVMEKVLELNKRYSSVVEEDEEVIEVPPVEPEEEAKDQSDGLQISKAGETSSKDERRGSSRRKSRSRSGRRKKR